MENIKKYFSRFSRKPSPNDQWVVSFHYAAAMIMMVCGIGCGLVTDYFREDELTCRSAGIGNEVVEDPLINHVCQAFGTVVADDGQILPGNTYSPLCPYIYVVIIIILMIPTTVKQLTDDTKIRDFLES